LVASCGGEVCWCAWGCGGCGCGVGVCRCSVSFDVGGGDSEVVRAAVGESGDGGRGVGVGAVVEGAPAGSVGGVFDGVVGDGVAAVVGCGPVECDCLVAACGGEVCWCGGGCCGRDCGVGGCGYSVSEAVGGGDSEVVRGAVGESGHCRGCDGSDGVGEYCPVGSVGGVFDGVVGDGVAAVVWCGPVECDCLVAACGGEVCRGRGCGCGYGVGNFRIRTCPFDSDLFDPKLVIRSTGESGDGGRGVS